MEVSQMIELINAVSNSEVEELIYEENGVSLKIRKHPKRKHPPLDHPDGPPHGCPPPEHGPLPPYPPFGEMCGPGQQPGGGRYMSSERPGGMPQGYPGTMQPGRPAPAEAAPAPEYGGPPEENAVGKSVPLQEEEKGAPAGNIVRSPLVGTFYAAASPDAEPFVAVGDTVRKGQILGIVEAMKLMNEIESDYEGEIVQILVKNGDMVEFDQPLFAIR